MVLREEDLALVAVLGSPLPHSTLQGAQHRLAEAFGMAALKFLENCHGHQRRRRAECVFQPNVDGRFSRSWTAFQMNVDAVSG
jgi:hypothetical protein